MSRKTRVAITLPQNKRGGPYISQSRIMESSLKEDFEFIPIFMPRIRELIKPRVFLKLIRKIKDISPDIYHFYGLQMDGFFSLLLLRIASKSTPTVLVIRGSSDEAEKFNPFLRFLVRYMESYTLRKASIIYGVSKYVSSWNKLKKFRSKYYGHIYNFLPRYDEIDTIVLDNLRNDLGLKPNDIVVISTGRIIVEKGYADLEKVISMNNYAGNVVFLIVGEGSYLDEMKKALNNTKSKVIFTGHVSDVNPYLNISDIYISLSWHETLGNSIIEALVHGIPCIVTNVGGIPELIEEDLNGHLVEVGDVESANRFLNNRIEHLDEHFISSKIEESVKNKISEKEILLMINELYNKAINTN